MTDIPKELPPHEALQHERRVLQTELEMQNEELRRAQVALEESRDRYVDLYEFAPIGYLTLTREGMIAEVNLTGATLLGVERKKLFNRRFDSLIKADDRDRWNSHCLNVFSASQKTPVFESTRTQILFHAPRDFHISNA